jgi:hypothetical protein
VLRPAACLVLALVFAPDAAASITVAVDAQRPALRVDAAGNAEVSWTAAGVRRFLLVPPAGRVFPGRRLEGADVSRTTMEPALPFRRVLRRTPDGRLWALQAWQVVSDGPVELRFSRWRGALPRVTLRVEDDLLSGRATFRGRAVAGSRCARTAPSADGST